MPRLSHEQTINTALGEVLQGLGRSWTVRSEEIGEVFEGGGRPDILVEQVGGWPIVIEGEVGNYRQAEIEAQARLGKRLINSPHTIDIVCALVYPAAIRENSGQRLRDALRDRRARR